MDVSVENTSNLGRRVTVRVPDATVQASIQERMQQVSKDAKLKGFRPGKIPKKIIQQKFGTSVRYEAIEQIMRQALNDAINEKELKPAGMPKINDVQDKKDEDLSFTAEFEIYPEFELSDMSKAEIEITKVNISDQDVSKQIEKLRHEMAEWKSEDKKIAENDQIKVDFDLLVDEKDAKKDEKRNVAIEVKKDALIPGLLPELVGKKKGDELSLDLSYPDTWPDEKIRGVGVHVDIKILDVLTRQPIAESEVNKNLKLEDGIDALKAHVKARMQEQVERMFQEETQEKVLEVLSKHNKFDLPQSLLEQEMDAMKRDEMRQAEAQKRKANIPGDDELKELAIKRVELGLLLNKVIDTKSIKADGNKVRQQIEILASQFPEPDKVVEIYYSNEELLGSIEKKVLLDSAVDAILKDMTPKEKIISFDEATKPKGDGAE
jgi:trigger factor